MEKCIFCTVMIQSEIIVYVKITYSRKTPKSSHSGLSTEGTQ